MLCNRREGGLRGWACDTDAAGRNKHHCVSRMGRDGASWDRREHIAKRALRRNVLREASSAGAGVRPGRRAADKEWSTKASPIHAAPATSHPRPTARLPPGRQRTGSDCAGHPGDVLEGVATGWWIPGWDIHERSWSRERGQRWPHCTTCHFCHINVTPGKIQIADLPSLVHLAPFLVLSRERSPSGEGRRCLSGECIPGSRARSPLPPPSAGVPTPHRPLQLL